MISNTVEEMTRMKDNLNTSRNDPEFGDHHDDTDEKLSVIKCVVGLTNYDLSVMINGKPSDPIDKNSFEKCFIKSRIQDAFYKVGFIPFTRKCLSNPLVHHELDENLTESDSLRKLQDDYITTTIEAEKLGFNNVFIARLPKVKKHIMKINTKERVEELIQKNKAFSCSGLHLYMGTMVANSEDVLEAQKRVIQSRDQQKQKSVNKANDVAYQKKQNAIHSYKLLKYESYKMLLPDWKAISMWVLPMDGENRPSKYTTKVSIESRLNERNPPFESYFTKYINDNDNKVTFKAKRLRGNKYEPIYKGEITDSNSIEIETATV